MQLQLELIELLDDRDLARSGITRGGGGDRRQGKIIVHDGAFNNIISLENLFVAWQAYRRGKRTKCDIQEFEFKLEDNIFSLHEDLLNGSYRPGGYQQFRITDPKTRMISKAPVRDQLLHQAIYQELYQSFDKTFIFDSFSCRDDKGTHKAFERLVYLSRKVSRNYATPCWSIKMDIKKFFDSIDHEVLLELLKERIADQKLLQLLEQIIRSFSHTGGRGMPLGNLTSQLFANVYMDPLDRFIKHEMEVRHYLRYADDFTILSTDPDYLLGCLVKINTFLKEKLKLHIHPNKVILRKLSEGIDFVGYVAFPRHQLPRHKTVKRMFRKLKAADSEQIEKSLPSYLGHLQHANSYKIMRKIEEVTPRL